MASLKCMIKKLRHKGSIDNEEYETLIKKLRGHDGVLCERMRQERWIPCEERLPEDGHVVLASIKDGDVRFACRWDGRWMFDEKGVEAWQEIPEPYRKEKKDVHTGS